MNTGTKPYAWVGGLSTKEAREAYEQQATYMRSHVYSPDDQDIWDADADYLRVLAKRAGWDGYDRVLIEDWRPEFPSC
jgi:hypothetical protein